MTKINIGTTISGAGAKLVYTYRDLYDFWLENGGKITADQQKRNLKTVLNKHLAYNHLSWESAIGPELADPIGPFENRLVDFGKSLVQSPENPKGLNSAYVDNLKTGLRQWHEVYVELVNSQPADGHPAEQPDFTTLREALKFHYAKYCASEKAKGTEPLDLYRLSLSINRSKTFLWHINQGPGSTGQSAIASSKTSIEMLEEILDVRPRGQLTQFVEPENQAAAGLGPNGARTQTLCSKKYYFTEAEVKANDAWARVHGFTGGIGDEFLEYVKKKCAVKTTDTARNTVKARQKTRTKGRAKPAKPERKWEQVRPASRSHKAGWKNKYISPDGGATRSGTARILFNACLSFLGCLRGVSEKVSEENTIIHYVKHDDGTPYSLDPLKFSMVYLCDAEIVMDVVSFLAERLKLEGKTETFTTTLSTMLEFCISLLNPDYGFVAERPAFGNRLPKPMDLDPYNEADQATWKNWCNEQRDVLKEFVTEMGEPVSTRDSFAPVMKWIDTQHPIDGLLNLERIMQQKLNTDKTLRERDRLPLERDLCLVRMITRQPLRILMYECLLTYDRNWKDFEPSNDGASWVAKDPTVEPSTAAHLYKKLKPEVERGYVWAIRFANDEFKNKRTKRKDDYDIEFDDDMTDHIEHYLTHIRPHLPNANSNKNNETDPLVFVQWEGEISVAKAAKNRLKEAEDENEDGVSEFLAQAFRKRTRKLLPGCNGFGPHNARHLVATEYIKNEIGGIEVVSAVLHDKPETVRKHYARYLPQDVAKHYTSYLSKYVRNRNGKS